MLTIIPHERIGCAELVFRVAVEFPPQPNCLCYTPHERIDFVESTISCGSHLVLRATARVIIISQRTTKKTLTFIEKAYHAL